MARALPVRLPRPSRRGLALRLGADIVAEHLPTVALQGDQPDLLDRPVADVRRVDPDAGQQHLEVHVLQTFRLLHDVRRCEVVAALLQHMDQELNAGVTGGDENVGAARFRTLSETRRTP